MAIKRLKVEAVDAISREDALMALTGEWTESRDEIIAKAVRRIKKLPPVKPQEEFIKNGTPLPKGHGRLIDADMFEKRLMDARLYYIGEKADDFDLRFAAGLKSAAERLVDAPTIIEADKAESED